MGIQFIQYSMRFYGEPKLKKPKDLQGVKQAFSVDYIPKKCKCPVFIKDYDAWIYHRDYFSAVLETEEKGAPLNVLAKKYCNKDKSKKFVYGDAWGSIVLRNEAWICIENLIYQIKSGRFVLDIINDICRQQERLLKFEEYELCCTDMERFWERVVMECNKITN